MYDVFVLYSVVSIFASYVDAPCMLDAFPSSGSEIDVQHGHSAGYVDSWGWSYPNKHESMSRGAPTNPILVLKPSNSNVLRTS